MLPFANRLKDASVWWDGRAHRVRATAGQAHGLHGMGHRLAWRVEQRGASAVQMSCRHRADRVEWPWSWTATLAYSLSASGLDLALAVRNDSDTSMPAVLGWHPYVPADWLKGPTPSGAASAVHTLDSDGLCHPEPRQGFPHVRSVAADFLRTAHTLALEGWHSPWLMHQASGERWSLSANAPHLVHHMPNDLAYVCVEPVTALPGALGTQANPFTRKDIELVPGARRELTCRLMVAA